MQVSAVVRVAAIHYCLAVLLSACGSDERAKSGSGTAVQAPSAQRTSGSASDASTSDALAGAAASADSATNQALPGGGSSDASGLPENPPLTPQSNDATSSTDPACYKATVTVCKLEQAIMRLTNAHRAADNQLVLDPQISFVARAWSNQEQAVGAISHAGFPAAREGAYLAEFSVASPYFLGAENVGTTYGTDKLTLDELAGEIVDMWWNSTGHRANMLGAYAVAGVGVSISPDARTIMVTQLFGAQIW